MEFENVREALQFLIEYNETARKNMSINGRQPTFADLQEVNCEVAYNICDFLGMNDLYLPTIKK